MKKLLINLQPVFLAFLIVFFVPMLILAQGSGKTDIKAMSTSQVSDIEGKPFLLGDAWKEKPIVLVFIRHFG